uniref:Uncharacterized protein n=1 Tax=Helicotheca tamesis TaxID=374047 RepID=A0A7S2HSG9_9STRA|mmetsp:Transcript_2330/g.3257  ORF Transcript_2330/g.3257 Transcript_2330/m.3257 type:complete len:246 (+) Transcript_2330:37-774(+)|eukprot:CAMPEP_0185725864 /NCGR_PEP_ID=MMETSP1171-20130828/2006_1 /TAXON_ID=374046 /ORGANISM="Helicotheca tamensis, Strain CCMP826" /LENGTH=245 /DNA_ID=CAMNT_0028394085 /DNA_START=20 /DNA_END=757 /DNA_ORIENTATION=-
MSRTTHLIVLTYAALACIIDGFVVQRKWSHRSAIRTSSTKSAADLFGSEGWKPIEKELDTVPIFTCANEKGHPLQYSVEVNDDSFPVPFFYCDVGDALEELTKARKETEMGDELDIIPFPLGKAFQLWATDKAVIIPSKDAIMQAGAPPGSNPLGQHVPLFACMDIMQEGEDGKPVLPLFFVLDEANTAVEEATQADGGSPEDFEVVSLSLPRAVELLAGAAEGPAFQFIPPKASIQHIEDYLSS